MLTEEPIKGVRKEPNVTISRAAFLLGALFMLVPPVAADFKRPPLDFSHLVSNN